MILVVLDAKFESASDNSILVTNELYDFQAPYQLHIDKMHAH